MRFIRDKDYSLFGGGTNSLMGGGHGVTTPMVVVFKIKNLFNRMFFNREQ